MCACSFRSTGSLHGPSMCRRVDHVQRAVRRACAHGSSCRTARRACTSSGAHTEPTGFVQRRAQGCQFTRSCECHTGKPGIRIEARERQVVVRAVAQDRSDPDDRPLTIGFRNVPSPRSALRWPSKPTAPARGSNPARSRCGRSRTGAAACCRRRPWRRVRTKKTPSASRASSSRPGVTGSDGTRRRSAGRCSSTA